MLVNAVNVYVSKNFLKIIDHIIKREKFPNEIIFERMMVECISSMIFQNCIKYFLIFLLYI